jgi:hypothetical protein
MPGSTMNFPPAQMANFHKQGIEFIFWMRSTSTASSLYGMKLTYIDWEESLTKSVT